MEKILSYIRQKYAACGVIVYGSYADGSHSENSDFDALVIVQDGRQLHDTSIVQDVQLDVFVYPRSEVENGMDMQSVLQIFDGVVVLDTYGVAEKLKQQVNDYLKKCPAPGKEEIQEQIAWCRKMLLRAQRGDAEGMFRWHWLLVDSLEIFCQKIGRPYFGPKKTLKWMQQDHPRSFGCYENALKQLDHRALSAWIDCLEQIEI